jgi:hypothetical protein
MKRTARVLVALLVSMTTGTIVLLAMGNNRPSAGPFCLASYYQLDPVEKAILSESLQSRSRWDNIEIYKSGTQAGNIEQLASLSGVGSPEDVDCHFVICNGLGGDDGQIQATEKWQRQWSIIPGGNWYGGSHTIRICIVADDKIARPTDAQIKRTESLIETLSRKFDIRSESVQYPQEWL